MQSMLQVKLEGLRAENFTENFEFFFVVRISFRVFFTKFINAATSCTYLLLFEANKSGGVSYRMSKGPTL